MRTLAIILITLLSVATTFAQDVPVELPDGFRIQKVAGNELVPDASAMTVDPQGAPVVSGPGYVRRLLDKNGDGVFDSFETLAETKGIAQGIWFDGQEMWLTVDGAIKRSVPRQDGKPFRFEDVVSITTDAEHGSHAIRKGPDGWWYVLSGNATKIRKQFHSLPDSPIKEPHAGFLMRFPAEVKTGDAFAAEVFCHGFRNAYDFDFDSKGNIFVYDSDGERDISLPWYRPTRIFRMKAGDHAGWVSAGWKRPARFHDMPRLVGELGRGSPTGVAVCDSESFGEIYRDAVFVGDWTFGRIGVAIHGGDVEIFAKPNGNFGFAITDLEFAPKGDLFVTTGGRGTEGSLYRISVDPDRKVDPERLEKIRNSRNPKMDPKMREEIRKTEERLAEDQAKQKLWIERLSPEEKKEIADRYSRTKEFEQTLLAFDSVHEVLNGSEIRKVQLMLGGCDGDRMFAGHQAKRPLKMTDAERESVAASLFEVLESKKETFEIARIVGMVQPADDKLVNALASVAVAEADPVKRIHYMNCLALAGGKLSGVSVSQVAESFLKIRREIDAAGLPVDRNWVPRMSQLADKLFHDMRIPEVIVKDPTFGEPADVWMFESLPAVFYDAAVARIASRIQIDPENVTRQQLRCISVAPKYRGLLREFSQRPRFTDIVVKAVHSNPLFEDQQVLTNGLRSFSLTVNKASLIGLRKIKFDQNADRDKVLGQALSCESRLGWSNPEVSVRDQIFLFVQGVYDQPDFGYEVGVYDLSEEQLKKQRKAIRKWKSAVGIMEGIPYEGSARSNLDLKKIDFDAADVGRGEFAFKKFQCAICHDGGGKNSGPSLAGISSRFSRFDIFEAIVDPDASVPERYRAVVVATEDGQLFQGSVVYESMAGIMLATGTGEVVRIDAKDIEARRKTNKSLMPAGLLAEATDQEVADLWAYLKGL